MILTAYPPIVSMMKLLMHHMLRDIIVRIYTLYILVLISFSPHFKVFQLTTLILLLTQVLSPFFIFVASVGKSYKVCLAGEGLMSYLQDIAARKMLPLLLSDPL